MPWQAHVIVGVPINSLADALTLAQQFGAKISSAQEVWDLIDFLEENPIKITIEGEEFTLNLYQEVEATGSEMISENGINSITGKKGNSFAFFGTFLTSRYGPTLLDKGWTHGRPDPFILDLDRLQTILKEVRQQWPDAQIMMMDIWH